MIVSITTALLLIDLQQAINHPSWGQRNNPQAEENIELLLAHWRQKNRPIIHVRHFSKEPNSTYRPGQPGAEFKPEATPRPGEAIFTKHSCNAFVSTTLENWLYEQGITQLIIVGVITNNSVEATARMAGDLGFQTVVVSDGTFTFDKVDLTGRLWLAEEVHALSLANLSGEYATICSTAELLAL